MNQKEAHRYLILDNDLGEESFVVVFRQTDSELCSCINKTLTEMKSDGTFEQIYQTWFSNWES